MMLLASYPYVFSQFVAIPNPIIVNIGLIVVMFCICMTSSVYLKTLPRIVFQVAIFQMISFVFLGLIHADKLDFVRCYFIIVTILFFIIANNSVAIDKYVSLNNWLLVIQALLAAVSFVLVFLGLLPVFFEFYNTDGRVAYCFGLTCTNSYVGNVIRPAGFFDEPGSLAFWGIYSLVLNKLYVKNKVVEFLLIVSLFFTLSVAYYIQVALYLFFFYVIGSKTKRNWGMIVSLSIVIAIFVVYVRLNPDSAIYEMTFGRFEITNGNLKIDSKRDMLAQLAREQFLKSPIFGVGQTSIRSGEYMGDNPYELLASDGIVGMLVVYTPLIFVMRRFRYNRDYLWAGIILFAGYLQRPFHCNILHFVMLYALFIMAYRDCGINNLIAKNEHVV